MYFILFNHLYMKEPNSTKQFAMTSFYQGNDKFPRKYSLASLRLWTYLAKQKDIITKVLAFHIDTPVDDIVKSISETDFDFLWLSSYMRTSAKVNEIIQKLQLSCGKKIIVWGPDVQNIDAHSHIIKIVGEGEIPLHTAISHLTGSKWKEEEIQDLEISDTIPLYWKEMFDSLSITPQDLWNKFAYYETNRWCLYSCGYCWHKTREGIYGFDNLLVKEEIVNIGKLGIEEVFIVDPILWWTKWRGKDVLRLFNTFAPRTQLTIYLRPEFVDDEYVELLKKTNLKELRVWIQTTNEKILHWIRSNNISQIKKSLTKLSDTNIPRRTELIAGLPWDTFDWLHDSLRFVIDELQPTYSYTYPLTVIEWTRLNSLVDKIDEPLRIKKNDKNKATSSSSYTEQDLNDMNKYATSLNSLYMHLNETKWTKLKMHELEDMLKNTPCFQDENFIKMAEASDYQRLKIFLSDNI